jgi:CDP-glucose 4,6-dehydratase
MDWGSARVLVTGATGMIGSWLVKALLERGVTVTALVLDADPQSELYRSGDVQRVTVVNGSLEDFAALERAVNVHEVDTVFHLGAQTIVGAAHRYPLATFESNIRGTYNLLEVCRLHRSLVRRLVIASSDKAYGEQERLPYTEETPLAGRHPYEVSKACCDLLAQSYHHTYELPVAIARCGNVYGGGDLNWSRIVPGTIRSLLRREAPVLRSDGTYLRDYIYVKDAAGAYLTLAEHLDDGKVQGQAFNFSAESPVRVLDLVRQIQRLMDCRIEPRILNDARGEIRSQHLCAAKARETLRWSSRYSLEDGLKETIAWYQSFLQ